MSIWRLHVNLEITWQLVFIYGPYIEYSIRTSYLFICLWLAFFLCNAYEFFFSFIYLDKILFGYKAAIMYLVNILSRYTPKICFGFVSYRDIRCVHDFTISNENVFHLRDFFIKKMNKFEGELNKNILFMVSHQGLQNL